MKFKEQRGTVFVFDGGHARGELELIIDPDGFMFIFRDVWISRDFDIQTLENSLKFNDIQTAVNLMQILINEGLV